MSVLIDRTIELSSLTFHYRQAGDPGAPPLILLHQLVSTAQDWDEIALTLATQYLVFTLDQRGHGESAKPGIYSFELMRDDLKAFADALSLDRFTLIGHSMGATVAYLFAERWPERVERLVIEDTVPPSRNRTLAHTSDEPPATASLSFRRNWQVITSMASYLSHWQVVASIARQLRNPDPSWWRDLPLITSPTLIISGGSTSFVPQKTFIEASHLIPDCRLVTIEGAGHQVHRNRPQEYTNVLRDFLFTQV